MSITIFENCAVFDGVSDERKPGMNVAVENDEIKEVSESPIRAKDATVFDIGGRTLMPGLIDAHVHIYSAFINYAHTADMPHTLMALHATGRLREILSRGFTTVRDVAGGDFGAKRAIEEGVVPGPRLFIGGRAMSMTGGHGDQRKLTDSAVPCACSAGDNAMEFLTRIVDGVPEMRRAVRDELRKGADHIKLLVSGGVGSPYDPLHGRQFSEEEVRAAVDEAQAWDKYVCAHSYTSRSTRFAVECGVRTIEHGNLIDQATAELMAEKGAFMVPTLVAYSETAKRGEDMGLSPVIMEKLRLVNEGGVNMLDLCRKAGVEMGFGTDLMGELNEAQSEEFLIRAEVLPAVEILKSATSVNARILMQEGRLGVVAPGALADLLVVDGNPLEDLNLLQDQGAHLRAIMQNGAFFKNEL
ncbi:metal-dependent hydrolase family protein [Elongatibacter sediminis]|uniref:Amidohydrolase family protein n=1 Tax=Elongatibacter sediminis TaxID=3119006 RepID=A0AAW9RGK0_9GAMM